MLGNLKQLRTLTLSHNQLSTLPGGPWRRRDASQARVLGRVKGWAGGVGGPAKQAPFQERVRGCGTARRGAASLGRGWISIGGFSRLWRRQNEGGPGLGSTTLAGAGTPTKGIVCPYCALTARPDCACKLCRA